MLMQTEREIKRELPLSLVTDFAAIFIPRWDRYPVQVSSGKYIQLPQPLTLETVAAHLEDYRYPDRQPVTVGAYALDEISQAKWVCFDADQPEQWQGLVSMAQSLKRAGVPAYLEQSRRGGHLWLFTQPLTGAFARMIAHQLLLEHGVPELKDVYPRQSRLVEGAGSFVRLPLGVHRKTGWVYHFVRVENPTIPLEPTISKQIERLAYPELVPEDFITDVLLRTPPLPPEPPPSTTFEKVKTVPGEKLSDRLMARMSVYDFVSQFIHLDKQGVGFCPFHQDDHHSFQVNISQNYWNCYAGCGGGTIIHFWQKWREMQGQDPSFKETVTELAKMLL